VSRESSVGAAVSVILLCVWVYFYYCRRGFCVLDCRVWGLYKVGIVGCSVGDECGGGRGSLVTG
jgi:hypothetical protein